MVDVEKEVKDYLLTHPEMEFTHAQLAKRLSARIGERDGIEICIQPQEIKYGVKSLVEIDEIDVRESEVDAVIINGEEYVLFNDRELLIYDIISQEAPDRVDEAERLKDFREVKEYIKSEIADEEISAGNEILLSKNSG